MAECSSNTDPTPTKKWACAYCTYLNWEASAKCVICNQQRNRPIFIEELSAIESATPTPNALPSSIPLPDQQAYVKETRWSCPACTYLNCRRTKKCAVCGSDRPSRYGSDSSLNESPTNQPAAPVISKELLSKWSCSVCTFDNWPNANKCTICGTLRFSPNADSTKEQKSRTPSPKTSNPNKGENQSIEEVGRLRNLNISGKNTEQAKLDYTTALDLYVRRYLGNDPVEKLFFKAVKAIGHRELQMVNRVVDFLINEGNLQRELTSFEARLMNQLMFGGGSGTYKAFGFERADSLFFLAKKSDCPDLLKLIRRVRADQEDRLPCALNCHSRTRLYSKVTQCLGIRDGTYTFKCQFIAHPHNFSILKLPMPGNDDLALAVQTALFRPAPSIPPQFCYMDCFDSMANRGGILVGRPPNFLMRNRGGVHSLYDSVFQCIFGVCDRFDILRAALKYTMHRSSHVFKMRWSEIQLKMARDCGLSAFNEEELENDWEEVLATIDAGDGCPEPIHIWALSHVVCRPIIVQSLDDPADVDLLVADHCENLPDESGKPMGNALAHDQPPPRQSMPHSYEGIYLPILWASPPITRSPLLLYYRNGQFSAVIVSDAIYQRDFEVQRYLRIPRSVRRPGVPEPLFRFLNKAESDDSAFLSQFILFGECNANQFSVRREAHQFLPESLCLYNNWMHGMLQVAAESGVPCTMVTTHKIESRMDTTAQKKWRNQAHAGTVAQLLAPAVGQHSRQRSFAFVGRMQQDGGNGQLQHQSDDE